MYFLELFYAFRSFYTGVYPLLLLVFTQMETYSTHWSSLYIFLKLVILR